VAVAVAVAVPTGYRVPPGGFRLRSARERMGVVVAYGEVGGYRGAVGMCGTTAETVRRVVERHETGG
jgi:hypothetical protein